MPFEFKYQIYISFKNKYEKASKERVSEVDKNVKILSKCISTISNNKWERKKYLEERERKKKNYEKYVKEMNSIKRYK